MTEQKAKDTLSKYKFFEKANYYFKSQSGFSLLEFLTSENIDNINKYLIEDWKTGMDNLYYDYIEQNRKARHFHLLMMGGIVKSDNLPETVINFETNGDDGWKDE